MTDSPIILRDRQIHRRGAFSAQPLPWSIDVLPGCRDLIAGLDFENTIRLDDNLFPDGTILSWRWPDHLPPGGYFWGYNYLAFGDYNDDAANPVVRPRPLEQLATMRLDVDYKVIGDGTGHNVLCDVFVMDSPEGRQSVLLELGVLLHVGLDDLDFAARGQRIGRFEDGLGIWEVVYTGPNPMGAPYVLFLPEPVGDRTGKVDLATMLRFANTAGCLDDGWIRGFGVGVEPHRGSGEVRFERVGMNFE